MGKQAVEILGVKGDKLIQMLNATLCTYQMAISILNEEIEHEQDIEDWLADLERMKEDIKKFRI